MTREQIEKAAMETVQNHFQCSGKYPCEERAYCRFCGGHNSSFDCKEDCTADDFNEGFIEGAQWRINSVWHDDISECKDVKRRIVVEYNNGNVDVLPDIRNLDGVEDLVVRVAYLDDLLPERKEKMK